MSVEVATHLLSGKSRYRELNDTATVLQISRSKDPRPRDGHKAVEQFVQLNGGPIKLWQMVLGHDPAMDKLRVSKSSFNFAWINAIEQTGRHEWYRQLRRCFHIKN